MVKLRYILPILLFLSAIAGKAQEKTSSITHTVERGETLYSISKMYDVTEDDVLRLNGKTDKRIYAGETLLIPNSGLFHTVVAGETLYQLSKRYGVTVEEICHKNPGLSVENFKAGQVIVIPSAASTGSDGEDDALPADSHDTMLAEPDRQTEVKTETRAVDMALVMPMTKGGGEQSRLIEFYEGMLVAIYDCKQRGISVNLDVFDSNAMSVADILSSGKVGNADLIIGPFGDDDIHRLSDYSKANDIPLLIPFTSDVDDVFNNPNLFQVNTPQSYLYSDVYVHFIERFKGSNVIILNDEKRQDKKAFIEGLQHELAANDFDCKVVSKSSLSSLSGLLVHDGANVIVPSTGDHTFLSEVMPALQNLVRGDETLDLHLFGYPEWQTYTHDYLSVFYELDTYFFTSFYANMLSDVSTLFANKYQSWYKKELMNTYPKYGMLGYDLMSYFIPYIWQYGKDFYTHLGTLPFNPLQTGLKFERVNNWGGFLNRKVFFVHFSKDFGLNILDLE